MSLDSDISRVMDIDEATAHIRGKGLLIYPTETVYGIGGLAFDRSVVEEVAHIKAAPAGRGYLSLVSGKAMLTDLGFVLTETANGLIDQFWPGPLTLLLPAPGKYAVAQAGFMGVRQSAHPVAAELVASLGEPLLSSSANISGQPAVIRAADLSPGLTTKCLVLANDANVSGTASTIVKVNEDRCEVIREGAISKNDLTRWL